MSTATLTADSRPVAGLKAMALSGSVTIGLALGIHALFGREPLADLLLRGDPWPQQLLWGIATGLLSGLPLIAIITRVRWFEPYFRQMVELTRPFDLGGLNPLWFSLCAGIGEELLCRGVLQPLAGICVTSVIFTLLHFQTGRFRTMNRWKALYALLIFVVSVGLGVLSVRIGLLAAMAAHTVVDIAGLTTLRAGRARQYW